MKQLNARKVSGYTLIEILIVLFIVSIVTTVALLSISRNENKEMETFANELTQMLSLAAEQAMLEPHVLGLAIGEHSVQFASLQKTNVGEEHTWSPLQDTVLGKHKVPSNVHIGVETGSQKTALNASNALNPQIVISTNGELTPFTIYVGKKGEQPRYAIMGDAGGNVVNKQLS